MIALVSLGRAPGVVGEPVYAGIRYVSAPDRGFGGRHWSLRRIDFDDVLRRCGWSHSADDARQLSAGVSHRGMAYLVAIGLIQLLAPRLAMVRIGDEEAVESGAPAV